VGAARSGERTFSWFDVALVVLAAPLLTAAWGEVTRRRCLMTVASPGRFDQGFLALLQKDGTP
jgi:hypothetical protein